MVGIIRKLRMWIITIPKAIITLPFRKELYNSKSYFCDELGKKQSPVRNFIIQIGQILKFGAPNTFFYLYGFDVKSRNERKEYIHYLPFRDRRDLLNNNTSPHSSATILRNKLYFDIIANSIGVTTPKIIAYTLNGQLFIWSEGFKLGKVESLSELPDQRLFCKELGGECGNGIFILEVRDGSFYIQERPISSAQLRDIITRTDYIIQKIITQHPEMEKLHSSSVNTIRLITVRGLKDKSIHVLPSILRVGVNGSVVDNTSKGGFAVGFDLDSGRLNPYGLYKPEFGRLVYSHPNSGIVLHDFYIPFIKEAKTMAVKFHSQLNDLHSIGWDIAIGNEGPIFIEGNDNWEINGPQSANYGLSKKFEQLFF